MLESLKDILGMSDSVEKEQKLRAQLTKISERHFQVMEWNGKIYITASDVPIKDSFSSLTECIEELNIIRTTWVEYLTAHPLEARSICSQQN